MKRWSVFDDGSDCSWYSLMAVHMPRDRTPDHMEWARPNGSADYTFRLALADVAMNAFVTVHSNKVHSMSSLAQREHTKTRPTPSPITITGEKIIAGYGFKIKNVCGIKFDILYKFLCERVLFFAWLGISPWSLIRRGGGDPPPNNKN